jgi:hypothetical protein
MQQKIKKQNELFHIQRLKPPRLIQYQQQSFQPFQPIPSNLTTTIESNCTTPSSETCVICNRRQNFKTRKKLEHKSTHSNLNKKNETQRDDAATAKITHKPQKQDEEPNETETKKQNQTIGSFLSMSNRFPPTSLPPPAPLPQVPLQLQLQQQLTSQIPALDQSPLSSPSLSSLSSLASSPSSLLSLSSSLSSTSSTLLLTKNTVDKNKNKLGIRAKQKGKNNDAINNVVCSSILNTTKKTPGELCILNLTNQCKALQKKSEEQQLKIDSLETACKEKEVTIICLTTTLNENTSILKGNEGHDLLGDFPRVDVIARNWKYLVETLRENLLDELIEKQKVEEDHFEEHQQNRADLGEASQSNVEPNIKAKPKTKVKIGTEHLKLIDFLHTFIYQSYSFAWNQIQQFQHQLNHQAFVFTASKSKKAIENANKAIENAKKAIENPEYVDDDYTLISNEESEGEKEPTATKEKKINNYKENRYKETKTFKSGLITVYPRMQQDRLTNEIVIYLRKNHQKHCSPERIKGEANMLWLKHFASVHDWSKTMATFSESLLLICYQILLSSGPCELVALNHESFSVLAYPILKCKNQTLVLGKMENV